MTSGRKKIFFFKVTAGEATPEAIVVAECDYKSQKWIIKNLHHWGAAEK